MKKCILFSLITLNLIICNPVWAEDPWKEEGEKAGFIKKRLETSNCEVRLYKNDVLGVIVRKPNVNTEWNEEVVSQSLAFSSGVKIVDRFYSTAYANGIPIRSVSIDIKDDYFKKYCLEDAKKLPDDIKKLFSGFLGVYNFL